MSETKQSHQGENNNNNNNNNKESEQNTKVTELSSECQKEIERLWGITVTSQKILKKSENHTYLIETEVKDNEKQNHIGKYILRLTPQNHRTRKAIQSEISFILFLEKYKSLSHNHNPTTTTSSSSSTTSSSTTTSSSVNTNLFNACLPKAIQNEKEEYIGLLKAYEEDNNEQYYAVLFEHAKGEEALKEWCGLFDKKLIESWGRAMAEMHNIIIGAKRIEGSSKEKKKWEEMEKEIPLCNETHGGASDIAKTIQVRANAGHEASKKLLKLWNEKVGPFLKSLGEEKESLYGIVHGDWNISNFFSQSPSSTTTTGDTSNNTTTTTGASTDHNNNNNNDDGDDKKRVLPKLWVFDFDQVHRNWFGFDIAVVMQGAQFFEDSGWAPGFDGTTFRKIFLQGYRECAPKSMVENGHLEPQILQGFEQYREFSHTSVAVDILFQSENGKHFDSFIISFCEYLVQRFQSKFI